MDDLAGITFNLVKARGLPCSDKDLGPEQHVTFTGKGRIVADGTKEHGGRRIRVVDIQVLDCELDADGDVVVRGPARFR